MTVYLDIAARSLLMLVFAVAVISKLRSASAFREFADSLSTLGARRFAGAVVAAETATVVLLAIPVGWGYLLVIALLTVFIAGIARAIRAGQPVACRCFGAGGRKLGPTHIVRNSLLVLIAAIGLGSGLLTSGPLDSLALAGIAAAGGAVLSLLFIRWDDMVFLVSTT